MYALPVLCLALMQNFPAGDQAQLFADLTNVRTNDTLSPETKMRAVAVQLAKNLGSELVAKVLTDAHEVFRTLPGGPLVSVPPPGLVIEETRKLMAGQSAQREAGAGGGAEETPKPPS